MPGTNREHIDKAVADATDVQILINNAGVAGGYGGIYNHSEEGARQEIETNYFGPMNLSRALADEFVRALKIDAKAVENDAAQMAHRA